MATLIDEPRLLRALATDGLEYIGTIELGGVVVIGDPAFLGRTPANGAYHAASTVPGPWYVFVRAEDGAPDNIVEVVACSAETLPQLWDVYDDAQLAAEIPATSGRLAILDGRRKDDVELRHAMFEPEELPWVLDEGCVVEAPRAHLARIFQSAETGIVLLSIALGPASIGVAGQPLHD